MSEKVKKHIQESEKNLVYDYPENPELVQAYMLKGIGYALLAIVEVLQNVYSWELKEKK